MGKRGWNGTREEGRMGKEGMEWDKGGRENGKKEDRMVQGRKVEWEKRG